MTAEVAVMNTGAIALAADSAVTVGSQKIYNSAIKLFALSKVAPIAIMVFGNAVLMSVPWELIIKMYRQQLGPRRFDTTDQYADDFISYIEKSPDFLSEEAGESWLLSRTLSYWIQLRQEAEQTIEKALEGSEEGLDVNFVETEFVNRFEMAKSALLATTDHDLPSAVLTKAQESIRSFAKNFGPELFGDLFPILENLLNDVGSLLLSKSIFPSNVSGLVIAGFGEAQTFPALTVYDIEGGLPGYLRRRLDTEKSQKISASMPATIIPFAQDDMVATFMEGVNPSFSECFNKELQEVFVSLPDSLAKATVTGKKNVAELRAKLVAVCKSVGEHLRTTLEQHRYEAHIHPVLQMVEVLPKNELAEMAETLVNLTAFKRRVTHSVESVGGPVDVCVISKGDGLVWVKRKHYFPADLNHHFYSNYREGLS